MRPITEMNHRTRVRMQQLSMKNLPREAVETPGPPANRKKGIGAYLNRLFNGEFLAREGMISHLPFIGFLVFLFMLHISMMYYYENTERALVKTRRELDTKNVLAGNADNLQLNSELEKIEVDVKTA